MFNDWKILSFSNTKKKIQKLFEIFYRLDLFNLEERLNRLIIQIGNVDNKISNFQQNHQYYDQPQFPPIPPTPPPYPPRPPVEPPVEEPLLADLTITNIVPTFYANYVNFDITVKNIGLINSTTTSLSLNFIGLITSSVIVPILEPDEEYIANLQQPFDSLGAPENHTLLAQVNETHLAIESDYDNNSASLLVAINNVFIPDPTHAYVYIHAHNPEGKEVGSLGSSGIFSIYNSSGARVYNSVTAVVINDHWKVIQIPDGLLNISGYTYVMRFNHPNINSLTLSDPDDLLGYNMIVVNSGLILQPGNIYTFTGQFSRLDITSLIQPNDLVSLGHTFSLDGAYQYEDINEEGVAYRIEAEGWTSGSPSASLRATANASIMLNSSSYSKTINIALLSGTFQGRLTCHFNWSYTHSTVPILIPPPTQITQWWSTSYNELTFPTISIGSIFGLPSSFKVAGGIPGLQRYILPHSSSPAWSMMSYSLQGGSNEESLNSFYDSVPSSKTSHYESTCEYTISSCPIPLPLEGF